MTWAQTVAMKLASAANARRGVGGFARSTRAATHRTLGCTLVLANPGAPPLPVVVRLVRIGPGHLDDGVRLEAGGELLDLGQASGCMSLMVGLEAVEQASLDQAGKRALRADIEKALG